MSEEQHLPRWRSPMAPADLMRYATRAVKAAERIMYDSYAEGDREMTLKAVTRLTQAAQMYARVVEVAELEERVAAIEASLEARKNGIHVN